MSTTWSCFDEKTGYYDYYESPGNFAINQDLPVPKLPPAGNKIGVAAIDAARRLPTDAKKVGRGWKAKGLVARCDGGGIAGFGAFELSSPNLAVFAAAAAAGAWLTTRVLRRRG